MWFRMIMKRGLLFRESNTDYECLKQRAQKNICSEETRREQFRIQHDELVIYAIIQYC
jgi:flagellar biosynthesis chaperone FliJ